MRTRRSSQVYGRARLLPSRPFPLPRQWERARVRAGLTVLEMLVSTAMLAFIVLGLTAMFLQTQKAFKSGNKQTSVTDAGRAVADMIAGDLAELTDAHFTNVPNYYVAGNPNTSLYPYPTNLFWQTIAGALVQSNNGVPFRTNELQIIYALVQTNNTWLGIGYCVSNWFTNGSGGPMPGVGTLYRYVISTNGPLVNTNHLFYQFEWSLMHGFTNFHRIADGVIHLKLYAYDASGNQDPDQLSYPYYPYGPFVYPTVVTNAGFPITYQTNYLPHSVDVEVGVLEPEAFEHARALYQAGATAAASAYLGSNAVGQVELFREHVNIPAAP